METSVVKPLNNSSSMETSVMKPGLFAFDFDHTIIDGNSCTNILSLTDKKLPKEVEVLLRPDDWTNYMQGIFCHLHRNGVTSEELKKFLVSMDFTPGLPDLIRWLQKSGFEVIIISDANSFFIDAALVQAGLRDSFTRNFTNPAYVDAADVLRIDPFHHQQECKLSNVNLCKGQVLQDYVKARNEEDVFFERVFYCGDGDNDFCPSLRLTEKDFAFARKGFELEKRILAEEENKVRANVVFWKTGKDILDVMQKLRA